MTAVQVLLVRHGHAGSKSRWAGDDKLRPLSARGQRDARRLVGVLEPFAPRTIVSSPYRRCLQTVEPLAVALDIEVEQAVGLAPDAAGDALGLLRDIVADPDPGATVVCTHGEVITDVFDVLVTEDRLGLGDRSPNEKGSVWVLDGDGHRFSSALYIAPTCLTPPLPHGGRPARGVAR